MAGKGPQLNVGGVLGKDDWLSSPSSQYQLILQQDGNLVIYDLWNGRTAIWASDTAGIAVNFAIMQEDGNFVIYGFPNAVWATDTPGRGTCFLTMQNDGNLVIYQLNAPVWASK
jgi:hypothetical protein